MLTGSRVRHRDRRVNVGRVATLTADYQTDVSKLFNSTGDIGARRSGGEQVLAQIHRLG